MPIASDPTNAPNKRNYVRFSVFTIALFWAVYLLESLTPLRIGHMQRDAMSWVLPVIATPLMMLTTWWRFRSAKIFAAGAIEVLASVEKIARSGVGVHRRVRLRYDFDERTYEKSVPIYESIVCHLKVGSHIPILVSRYNPHRITVPLNMEWID